MTLSLTQLSPRRREVAELVGDGLSYAQIAERLTMTIRTARLHVAEIADQIGRDDTKPYHQVMRWVLLQRNKAA